MNFYVQPLRCHLCGAPYDTWDGLLRHRRFGCARSCAAARAAEELLRTAQAAGNGGPE